MRATNLTNSTNSTNTASSPSESANTVSAEPRSVSFKAAILLGLNSSSGHTNKTKPGNHSARRPKATHTRPAKTDIEAGTRTIKDPANSASPEQHVPSRTEEILRRLLSQRRNVVFCLVFLFSVIVGVSVISGFQVKGKASNAAESTRFPQQIPQSSSSSNSSIMAPSSQIRDSAASPSMFVGQGTSQAGMGGGQFASSLEGRMVVTPAYQRTAPTPPPL